MLEQIVFKMILNAIMLDSLKMVRMVGTFKFISTVKTFLILGNF